MPRKGARGAPVPAPPSAVTHAKGKEVNSKFGKTPPITFRCNEAAPYHCDKSGWSSAVTLAHTPLGTVPETDHITTENHTNSRLITEWFHNEV